ncbi:coiled-coil domain-containing protein 83 [Pimephales promelas]|uniref:coiled-coil domain-containing protein 83 n=1 Tax=Pimephales promelas TaxID=90988 RepID=UPI001955D516|nr:coiled-coil domain-containing protein 83 [Pimephales promelas]
MPKTDATSLAEAFIRFQIQVKKKEIHDYNDEMCQLEDKKQKLIKLQEQLREENTHHVCELSKRIKEQERDLEQRQGEYEVHVKQTTRENLELKLEQEKHQEELRSKLARLQVQVEELQTDMQELLQYKNEGSNKDHQKIEKLEKMIAYAQMNFQELSEYFQKSLAAAVEKNKQTEAKIEDKNQLALKVPLYIKKVAVLESTVQQLEKENLEHIDNLFKIRYMDDPLISQDDEFLAQSARAGSHDTRSMDRNITKISLEDTSALVNRPPYSLQPSAEEAQQERDATACDGTTPSTPPDLSKMYSSQTTFTRPMHLDLMGWKLLHVIGKASPLHPPPINPVDVSEEMSFDQLQNAEWPITTKIINRAFRQSASQSAE